ncbi:hypothetical protein SEA_KEELAN_111 [Gordonia phage Keelan]|nr:hypothetical protein SEA_KEELAN_111 [Gordonia phage Keelan]
MRDTLYAHGFDWVDTLQKHWHKGGTATYPLVFRDQDGNVYDATQFVTEGKTTVVELVRRNESGDNA